MKKSIVISLLTATILFCTALCSFASTGIVTTDTLRLREDASVDASIVALLSMSDEVEILEEENGWYKVKAEVNSEEVEGYVSADYIEVSEETSEENEVEEEEANTEEEQSTETEEEKEMIKVLSSGVKVYLTPIINSIVLDTTEEEIAIEVISEVNGWSYVESDNIKGWVRTENITEKEASETEQNTNNSSQKTGYISGNSVNFREEASTSGTVIETLSRNTEVKVLSEDGDWTKIEVNGTVGYVSSSYISDEKVTTTTSRSSVNRTSTTSSSTSNSTSNTTTTNTESTDTTTSSSSSSVTGAEIVAYAKKYLGYKYVYGGSSPSTGFDCSGFTTYVYKHFGYSLSRTSSGQASNGTAVSKSNLQQGDIICFSRSSGSTTIGHVGIYIGDGKFIHSANSRKGVITSNVSGDGYYFVCARRII